MTNPINNPVAGPVCAGIIKAIKEAGWTVFGPGEADEALKRLIPELMKLQPWQREYLLFIITSHTFSKEAKS